MNILAFDCSTEYISIALQKDKKIKIKHIYTKLKHSEMLLEEILAVIKKSKLTLKNIDLIVCGKGPGSFTGLRIAMATAKGLADGLDIPLISVEGLFGYKNLSIKNSKKTIIPVIDGKKNRYYTIFLKAGSENSAFLDKSIENLEKILSDDNKYLITGPDAKYFFFLLKRKKNISLSNKKYFRIPIEEILKIGYEKYLDKKIDPPNEGPIYIRKSQAEEL